MSHTRLADCRPQRRRRLTGETGSGGSPRARYTVTFSLLGRRRRGRGREAEEEEEEEEKEDDEDDDDEEVEEVE